MQSDPTVQTGAEVVQTAEPNQSQNSSSVWQKHNDSDKFVGQQACKTCHTEIWNAYTQTHSMARSLYAAVDVPLVSAEQPDVFDPQGPCRYEIARHETGMQQTEEFVDSSGVTVYRDTVQVDYAVGSGQRGWSFLTDRGGILTQAVATWYSGRQVWDLSPGYVPENHPRFSRRISDGCVACHAGRTSHLPGEPHRFGTPVFQELSIGCERCHGPGKEHVDFHTATVPGTGQDPIVNPAQLGFAQQLSVCYQCHLHGEERIVRNGRSEFDFRPGEVLSDVWATFVRAPTVQQGDSIEAVSPVEQMHSSRCFQQSDQRMTCTTCHDPHRLPAQEDRTAYYRQRCLDCHEQTDSTCAVDQPTRLLTSAEDSCIQCHMPSMSATDVPHTAQTDHRILRRPSAVSMHSPESPTTLMAPSLFPLPEPEQRRARGLLLAAAAESRNDATSASSALLLLNPLLSDQSSDLALLDAVAACSELIGDLSTAEACFERALKLAPRNDRVLRGLLIISHKRGKPEQALRYAEKILQLCPHEGAVHFQKASLLRQLGQNSEAFEACREALRLMPDDVEVRTAIIQLAEETGMTAVAAEERQLLQRIREARSLNGSSDETIRAKEQ